MFGFHCEGDFLFSPLFVGRSPLRGDAPFGASLLSAKWPDPIERSAVSSQGSVAVSTMALGWQEIESLCISCVGASAVMTLLHISSAGTAPITTDSRSRPHPASSLAIAMPAVLNGAITSLHKRHQKQRLLFFQNCSCDCTAGTPTKQQ